MAFNFKSALDDALDKFKNKASSTLKKTVSNVAEKSSPAVGKFRSFYNSLAQDQSDYQNRVLPSIKNSKKVSLNLPNYQTKSSSASLRVGPIPDTGPNDFQKAGDFTKKFTTRSSQVFEPSMKRAAGVSKASTGLFLDLEKKVVNSPLKYVLPGTSVLSNILKNPEVSKAYDQKVSNMLKSAQQDIQKAEEEKNRKVAPIEDKGFMENIKNPEYLAEGLTYNAPSFLLSLGVGAVGTVLGGPAVGLISAMAPSYLLTTGDVYDEAKKMGADEETSRNVANLTGVASAALDAYGISDILDRFGGKQIKGIFIKKLIQNMAKSSFEEGATESMQQIIQNTVARFSYDKERDLTAGIPESAFFGALMAGPSSVTTDIALEGVKAYSSMTPEERQAGFIKFPGSEEITNKDEYKNKVKEILDKESERILSMEKNPDTGTYGEMITDGRRVAKEYQKNPDIFIDKYKLVPETLNSQPKTNPQEASTDPLIQEARKYKSAEEFVKAQGQTLYRGQGGTNKFSGVAGTASGKNFATDVNRAKSFGNVDEFILPKNAKVLKVDVRGKSLEDIAKEIGVSKDAMYSPKKLREELLAKGYDALEETTRLGINGKITAESPTVTDIIELKPDTLKLKSQLTDIWNKANQDVSSPSQQINSETTSAMDPADIPIVQNALEKIYSTIDPEDYITPDYADSEAIVRDFARKYIGEDIANNAGIDEIVQAVSDYINKNNKQTTATIAKEEPVQTEPNPTINGQDIDTGPTNNYQTDNASANVNTVTQNDQVSADQYTNPQVPPEIPLGPAIWRGKIADQDVVVNGYLGIGPDGKHYVSIEGSQTGVPAGELVFAGKKESKLIDSIRKNESNRENIKKEVYQLYDTTTDEGRMDLGREYVKNNYELAKERALSGENLSNELAAIYFALDEYLQTKADEAEAAGNLDLANSLDRQAIEVNNKLAEKVHEPGQIIQFLHLWSQRSPQAMVRWARRVYEQANEGLRLNNIKDKFTSIITGKEEKNKYELTKKDEAEIMSRMKKINKMKAGREKNEAILKLMREIVKPIPPTVMQYTDAYRYENMLSGPRTHMKNAFFNVLNAEIIYPAVMTQKAVNDFIISSFTGKERTSFLSDVPKYYRGQFSGLSAATEEFAQVMNGTMTALDFDAKYGSDFDMNSASINALVTENMPIYISFFKRLLLASDRFMTNIIAAGQKDINLSRGMSQEEAVNEALKTAAYWLYNNKNDPYNETGQGPVLQSFDRFKSFLSKMGSPKESDNKIQTAGRFGFRLMVPFVNIVVNVAKMSFEFNPVTGPLTLIGSKNKADQIAKMQLGAYVAIGFAGLAMNGMTTWELPEDEKSRELFYASGRKPYSFYVPAINRWVPISYLGPLSWAAAMPVALNYYQNEQRSALTDSQIEKITKTLTGAWTFFSEQTPLTGVGGLVRTVSGDIDFSVGKQLGFTTTQGIPWSGALRYISTMIDPVFRKSKGPLEEVKKIIPGMSKDLEPYTTPTGEESIRNITDYVLPMTLGVPNPGFDQLYQERVDTLQQNALNNEIKKAIDNGSTVSIKGESDGKKLEDSVVKERMKLYFETTNPELRFQIEESLKSGGWSMTDALISSLEKDISNNIRGLTGKAKEKTIRSNDFKTISDIIDKYGDVEGSQAVIEEAMKKKNITYEDMIYDGWTALNDDIQLDQIISNVEGLSNDDMLSTLVSYRRISEGTGKAFLTDTLINKMEDSGLLSSSEAEYLKSIEWDSKTKSLKAKKSKGNIKIKKISVSAPPKISTSSFKIQGPPKISLGSIRANESPLKGLLASMPQVRSIRTQLPEPRTGRISLQVKPMTTSIYQLGKV